MAKAYEDKLVNPIKKYEGSEKEMVIHLTQLWKKSSTTKNSTINRSTINFETIPNRIDLNHFKNTLSKVSDNLVFRGNFGAYDNKLEKEMSLTKKSIIMNKKNCRTLYLCLNDLIRYNSIRPELFNNIKFADIFIKHKKGDNKDPKNFRFLSNHTKIFKIIDKFWTNSLINMLEKNNALPDKSIVKNNFSREFTVSIRDLALEKVVKVSNGKKIVLLDIQKAFDSVSWTSLNELVIKNISRKINKIYAEKMMAQYMFLNTNRCILFQKNRIKCNRSIATGLPSSTIIFSLIIEELIYQWKNEFNIEDVIVNTFVDDMYLEFNDTKNSLYVVQSLINFLEKHNLIINETKTKTNIESLPYSQIGKSDCYLGLPFASDKNNYINECIKMFKERYYDISVEDIIDILKSDTQKKVKREILGFFNYKLYGLKKFEDLDINVLSILEEYKNENNIRSQGNTFKSILDMIFSNISLFLKSI